MPEFLKKARADVKKKLIFLAPSFQKADKSLFFNENTGLSKFPKSLSLFKPGRCAPHRIAANYRLRAERTPGICAIAVIEGFRLAAEVVSTVKSICTSPLMR